MRTMTKLETETGIEIQASMIPTHSGLYRVVVIERFASGNFCKKEHENVSEVAAQGLLHFYTGE